MTTYSLQPNEVVLLRETPVYRGNGTTCELILTNLNLVMVRQGTFRKNVGVETFPIKQIKIFNGRAHALMKSSNNSDVLEVFFRHGEEEFRFPSGGKKKVQLWIGKINEAVTGERAPEVPTYAIPGADLVAGVLKDTMSVFRAKRGGKDESSAPTAVSSKCTSCGAPVSGFKGRPITCDYCGAAQQL
jgi:hypothetical protein